MFKREFEVFLKDDRKLRELLEGGKPFVQFEEEIYAKPFLIEEPKDFELPKNYPNCCEFHKGIPKYIQDWFDRFPNCCKRHSYYEGKPWFKREAFLNVPEKIRLQLLYTEHHIATKINDVDWYKSITDYLEYNIASFGSPEVGADRYISIIESFIRNADESKSKIDKKKRELLTEYFDRLKEPIDQQKTDLNILYSIFNKWVKTIPDIGHFQKIKNEVANKFPMRLILYGGEYNPYLGETKFRTRTRSELIDFLIEITKNTLLFISNERREETDETNYSDAHLDIVKENHRLKQNRLLIQYNKRERKYIKILKQWLKNEKQFFKEIQEILANSSELKGKPEVSVKKSELLKKIARNNIEEVLEALVKETELSKEPNNLNNQAIHQLGRFHEIQVRIRSGTVTNEDYLLEVNRIRQATIELVKLLEK